MNRRWKIFLVTAIATIVADQLTKIWARTLPVDDRGFGVAQTVIESFWDWRLSFNKGSAFGLFHGIGGARVFLTLIGIAALVAVYFMVKAAREDQRKLVAGLGLVAGGAVGNLIDRIAFGEVTDFVVWKYHSTEWPTFNIADIALVVGVGLMLIDMIAEGRAEKARRADADSPGDGGSTKPKRPKRKR
jgi:signal peptidase II